MSRIQKLENIYKEQLKNHNINDVSDFIHSIVNADITKGKYARFLIESFLNDKFLEEDLIGGLDSTVGQAIRLFDKHKHKLPIEYRSVYAVNQETGEALYQSPGNLWNSVKQYQDELSGKELKKEEQEKIYRETEFIYKDENTGFQIVSPLTEESAKWWGKGTRWCTSAENNNMFEEYAKDAPLFILLMPDSVGTTGNGDKLQLWKNGKNIQFMDEADNEIELDYIEKHWNILEPVCLLLNNLKYIPLELRTKKMCELAVQENGMALSYVSDEYKTSELCEIAVQQSGWALQYIPLGLRTKKVCELAVKQNGLALKCVPEDLKTKELCELAIKNNGCAIDKVPHSLITKELCETAVKQDGCALIYVSEALRTSELCELAIQQNGLTLSYILKELRTKELCELAVKQNGWSLKYVPYELKTKELCELAVQKDGSSLKDVPLGLRTKELCELAVKQNKIALWHVPARYKTKELCELAVQQNGTTLHHVKDEVFELPIKKYQEIFQEIKTLFPKKDVSLDCHYS
jgi:hypothetical protein